MNVHTAWPWLGLALVPILLVLLFYTDLLRGDPKIPRWKDYLWLAWLLLPVYMIHQFEEHGIDLRGHYYAFREALCGALGFPYPSTCPLSEAFFTAVNLGTVWGSALISGLWGRGRPLLALAAWGIPAINGVTHIAQAIYRLQYNPGLLTSIILFLPLSVWVIRRAMAEPSIGRSGAMLILKVGVSVHVVLIGSILVFVSGKLSEGTLIAVNLLNTGVPALIAAGFRRPWSSTARPSRRDR